MWTTHAIYEYGLLLLRIGIELGILTFLIYSILLFLRGTRAMPVLSGITLVVIALSFVSQILGLEVIEWLVLKMWALLAISILIIFQAEIRRALAEIGSRQGLISLAQKDAREAVDVLLDATFFLAERRLGALLAIQQKIGMRAIAETGTIINAPLTAELLTTFFFPNTPLHDGGVIIQENTILAAGCIFPLTQDSTMSKTLGTRHRAGVGISEEFDAVVIIVSEETGAVSLAHKGRLLRGLNRPRLERHLVNFLLKNRNPRAQGWFSSHLTKWLSTRLTGTTPSIESEDDSGNP